MLNSPPSFLDYEHLIPFKKSAKKSVVTSGSLTSEVFTMEVDIETLLACSSRKMAYFSR